METNLDSPNFGIQNTMTSNGSAGDSKLLDELLSPETSTSDPDDISPNIDDDNVPKKKEAKKGEDVDDDTAADPEALTNFLIGDEEEEDDDNDDDNAPPAKKAPVAATPKEDDDEEEEEEEDDSDAKKPAPKKEGSDDDDDNNEEEGNIAFDALATELAELGVFNRLEGEEEKINVTNAEEFLERFNLEKKTAANQIVSDFIGQFGEDYQEAFQAIYVNGVEPQTYFSTQAKIENFKDMDLTKESNQEKVVREMLVEQGFDPEDQKTEVERLKSYGDLEETSKRYHKVLVKKESKMLEQKVAEAQQQQQQKAAIKEQYVNKVRDVLTEKLKAKEFDGIPLNPKTANELQDFLLVDKWKTNSGETLTDFDKSILELKRPENHEQKVKVALLLKLLEKDPTLSTIQKRGVSKKSSALFKEVAKQKTTAKRAEEQKKQPARSWFNN